MLIFHFYLNTCLCPDAALAMGRPWPRGWAVCRRRSLTNSCSAGALLHNPEVPKKQQSRSPPTRAPPQQPIGRQETSPVTNLSQTPANTQRDAGEGSSSKSVAPEPDRPFTPLISTQRLPTSPSPFPCVAGTRTASALRFPARSLPATARSPRRPTASLYHAPTGSGWT